MKASNMATCRRSSNASSSHAFSRFRGSVARHGGYDGLASCGWLGLNHPVGGNLALLHRVLTSCLEAAVGDRGGRRVPTLERAGDERLDLVRVKLASYVTHKAVTEEASSHAPSLCS